MEKYLLIGTASLCLISGTLQAATLRAEKTKQPNVIIILTDDAGIGDFGFNGNPLIKTPNLDQLAARSILFTNFFVSPVCAPTRASLLTGKFSQSTGVYDTYNGGAVMATEEITLAEVLHDNGYQTGIFGKWHLGDNYPYRPVDQGFSESFVFKGGGIGQPGDYDNYFKFDSAYFNPVMYLNEKKVTTEGYCSDVFTNEALRFIRREKNKPFFVYLAFNAPHTPLQVPEKYTSIYKNLSPSDFSKLPGSPQNMTEIDLDAARKVYGMMTNVDDNIGRLMKELKDQDLIENTIIIFLSDNGPQQNRYKMELRGLKGSVYQGGIKTPCLIHYPGTLPKNREIATTAAHIDLLPTILDLCKINSPVKSQIEGRSLIPLLEGFDQEFRNRTLFFEWGRGFPIPYRNFAAMNGGYKLVGNTDRQAGLEGFELFDLSASTDESKNILIENMEKAQSIKAELDKWYLKTVSHPNNRRVYPAIAGTKHENPVVLNRNDAKGSPGIWEQEEIFGYWDVRIATPDKYAVKANFIKELKEPGTLYLKMNPHQYAANSQGMTSEISIPEAFLDKGDYRLEIYYQTKSGKMIFPLTCSVLKLER
jgi:arylsulfatase A-like enzyme